MSTPTTLPIGDVGDMVVDGAHSHVFVSSPGSNAVLVLDYQGTIIKTIAGEAGANAMVLIGSTLYVTLSTGGGIDRIDTVTLTETSILTQGSLLRPSQLVLANGALWTGTQSPDYNNVCVSRVNITTGAVTTFTAPYCYYNVGIRPNPTNNNMLITWGQGLSPATIVTLDVATGSPVTLQSRGESLSNLKDIAGGPTGTSFITASGSPYEFDEWRYSDLQQNGIIYAASAYPTAVATTAAAGGLMAGGLDNTYGNAVWVYGFDQPANQIFSGYFGAEVVPRGLAFRPDGHSLFVVSSTWSGQGYTTAFVTIALQGPTVTGLVPSRGPAAGGTSVTIGGSRFLAGTGSCQVTSVHFGSVAASLPGTCTDSSITVNAPPGWPSSPDVTVTTSDGTSEANAADKFTYEPRVFSTATGSQYQLSSSDGTNWTPMDTANLKLDLSPTADSIALVGANTDLWTADAGYNQDIAVFVNDNSSGDVLTGWKESGGFAGTFSPNAAFLQIAYPMIAGHTYRFTLKWKTNTSAVGRTIYAGAGPINGPFSPTRMTARVVSRADLVTAASTYQYRLSNASGNSWYEVDPNLRLTRTPQADSTAVLGANADLWTADAGFNQDLAIFVSDNGGIFTLVAWKESGGFAGTYSPNAAYVQAVYSMQAGHAYVFLLAGKPNHDATGKAIYIGAGPAPADAAGGAFSPTRLTAEVTPGNEVLSAVSTSQYHLTGNNGSSWTLMDSNLTLPTVTPGSDATALLGANADLWTADAGCNQDMAIFVVIDGDTTHPQLLGWKESGGFAGTFSPNAAFLQSTFPMTVGHTYTFSLSWKTNLAAPGKTIYAGAGPFGGYFSPTRLTAQVN